VISNQHDDITDEIRRITISEVSGLRLAKPSQPIDVDPALYGLSVILASAMAMLAAEAPQITNRIIQVDFNNVALIVLPASVMLFGFVVYFLFRRSRPHKR
jgi:hypothetical protein